MVWKWYGWGARYNAGRGAWTIVDESASKYEVAQLVSRSASTLPSFSPIARRQEDEKMNQDVPGTEPTVGIETEEARSSSVKRVPSPEANFRLRCLSSTHHTVLYVCR